MEELIKALQIFLKYGNPDYPTHCEHDVLSVYISPKGISKEDLTRLGDLGFFPVDVNEEMDYEDMSDIEFNEDDYFKSYKYGSC